MWGVNVVSPSEAMLQHCVSLPGGVLYKIYTGRLRFNVKPKSTVSLF